MATMRKPVYAICEQQSADQPVHLRSLISTFVVYYLDCIISLVLIIMPPTSKKLTGHIGFGLSVRPSVHPSVHGCVHVSVRQKPCMLGFWNFIYGFLVEKYLTHVFFLVLSYFPFWSYAPLNKIRMKSDACHILWTVHTRVLKFHIWIPRGKIADSYFFLVRVTSLSGVMPLWKKQHEILWARYLKVFELGVWNLVSL